MTEVAGNGRDADGEAMGDGFGERSDESYSRKCMIDQNHGHDPDLDDSGDVDQHKELDLLGKWSRGRGEYIAVEQGECDHHADYVGDDDGRRKRHEMFERKS